jgi:hypothetical protein
MTAADVGKLVSAVAALTALSLFFGTLLLGKGR